MSTAIPYPGFRSDEPTVLGRSLVTAVDGAAARLAMNALAATDLATGTITPRTGDLDLNNLGPANASDVAGGVSINNGGKLQAGEVETGIVRFSNTLKLVEQSPGVLGVRYGDDTYAYGAVPAYIQLGEGSERSNWESKGITFGEAGNSIGLRSTGGVFGSRTLFGSTTGDLNSTNAGFRLSRQQGFGLASTCFVEWCSGAASPSGTVDLRIGRVDAGELGVFQGDGTTPGIVNASKFQNLNVTEASPEVMRFVGPNWSGNNTPTFFATLDSSAIHINDRWGGGRLIYGTVAGEWSIRSVYGNGAIFKNENTDTLVVGSAHTNRGTFIPHASTSQYFGFSGTNASKIMPVSEGVIAVRNWAATELGSIHASHFTNGASDETVIGTHDGGVRMDGPLRLRDYMNQLYIGTARFRENNQGYLNIKWGNNGDFDINFGRHDYAVYPAVHPSEPSQLGLSTKPWNIGWFDSIQNASTPIAVDQLAIRSSSTDPTTLDIMSGASSTWYNTTTGEIRHFVNQGGSLYKSAAYIAA